jgi:hypothetical protein
MNLLFQPGDHRRIDQRGGQGAADEGSETGDGGDAFF